MSDPNEMEREFTIFVKRIVNKWHVRIWKYIILRILIALKPLFNVNISYICHLSGDFKSLKILIYENCERKIITVVYNC